MSVKFTKREAVLICVLLAVTGLLIGVSLAHNDLIDEYSECRSEIGSLEHEIRSGSYLNFSDPGVLYAGTS